MNNLNGFEWDPSMGVLPEEGKAGSFEDRPTHLTECPCGCGQPYAQYVDGDKEEVMIQTYALRAQAADVPLEVYMSAVAEAMLEKLIFSIGRNLLIRDLLESNDSDWPEWEDPNDSLIQ